MKPITTLLLFTLLGLNFSYARDIELELFASNLDRPVNIKHAGKDRFFIAEQDGLIKIVNSNGTLEIIPFLDIVSRFRSTGNEQGLLRLAFHPDYTNKGYFFVNYIDDSGSTVISRFSRNITNPSIADPNSELIILTYSQPFSNHNGGEFAFGADGYLYISSGDGGNGGDPPNNAQNLNILLGKILRIEIDNSNTTNPYEIPADNPYVNIDNARDEIWCYGLRNPWKFSFDRSTNDLWIADVGQNAREEIKFTPSKDSGGLNYGWRCYEGNTTFNTADCLSSNTLTFPVSEYAHSEGRCSITGGYVYRGSDFPNFDGLYFFADVCSQDICYLRLENGSWVSFGEDISGELYISRLSGNIYKLTDTNLNMIENQVKKISVSPNPNKTILYLNFSKTTPTISTIITYNLQGNAVKIVP